MQPSHVLRVEALAVLGLAVGFYVALEGPGWLVLTLALAPDLSMLGYLRGPRVGSLSYNVFHTYTLPIALGVSGLWMDHRLAIIVATIWIGHIAADRLLGYGLKFNSGFRDTHLSSQPAPLDAFTGSE